MNTPKISKTASLNKIKNAINKKFKTSYAIALTELLARVCDNCKSENDLEQTKMLKALKQIVKS